MEKLWNEQTELPPGFRFHPTDEELITHYLREKVYNINFSPAPIGTVDLNKVEPWDLPGEISIYVCVFLVVILLSTQIQVLFTCFKLCTLKRNGKDG